MFAEERRKEIVTLLKANQSISVKELCDTLMASEATIRRDLTFLEDEGTIQRTHGGAMLSNNINVTEEPTFFQKESIYHEEKIRIAEKAFAYIEENDSVVIDSGTTTLALARLIGESNIPLVVVTNSSMVAHAIAKNEQVELYTVGGKIRLNTLATVGNLAIESLKKFNVNKSFIGSNGITIENGLTTPDLAEADVKRTMIHIAAEVFVLADSSKFNKVALCEAGLISMIDHIITDTGLDADMMGRYLRHDIDVVRV